MPEGYENAGRVVANSNSQEDSYFTDGGFEMVEGNPITTEIGSQVLIHEKFAQRNGLSVGDTMLLGNVEDKDKTIPVTVAGIFTNTEEQDSIGMAPSYDFMTTSFSPTSPPPLSCSTAPREPPMFSTGISM